MEIYFIVVSNGDARRYREKTGGAFLKAMEAPGLRTMAENLYEDRPLSRQKLKEYIEWGIRPTGKSSRRRT